MDLVVRSWKGALACATACAALALPISAHAGLPPMFGGGALTGTTTIGGEALNASPDCTLAQDWRLDAGGAGVSLLADGTLYAGLDVSVSVEATPNNCFTGLVSTAGARGALTGSGLGGTSLSCTAPTDGSPTGDVFVVGPVLLAGIWDDCSVDGRSVGRTQITVVGTYQVGDPGTFEGGFAPDD